MQATAPAAGPRACPRISSFSGSRRPSRPKRQGTPMRKQQTPPRRSLVRPRGGRTEVPCPLTCRGSRRRSRSRAPHVPAARARFTASVRTSRAPRHRAGPVPRPRHPPPQVRLPGLRGGGRAGACARTADRGRATDRQHGRTGARLEVCGSSATVSAGPDLRPPRRPSRSLDTGGLGRPRRLWPVLRTGGCWRRSSVQESCLPTRPPHLSSIRGGAARAGPPAAGRVSAVENVFIGASNELGAFESGVAAAALLGVGPAVVLGGVATMAVTLAVWTRSFPELRDLDTFDDAAGADHPGPADAEMASDRNLLEHELPAFSGPSRDREDTEFHEEDVRRIPGFHQPGQRDHRSVGLVMALYFKSIVDAFINGVIMPVVSAIVGEENFDEIDFGIGERDDRSRARASRPSSCSSSSLSSCSSSSRRTTPTSPSPPRGDDRHRAVAAHRDPPTSCARG